MTTTKQDPVLGSEVVLKGQIGNMIVTKIEGRIATCSWHGPRNEHYEKDYPFEALEVLQDWDGNMSKLGGI